MKTILLAVAVFALAAGCKKSPGDEMLGRKKEFKETMCACKDEACVEQAGQEMMGWMMKNAEKFKDVKPTKEQDEAADKLQDEMEACKKKFAAPAADTEAPK